MLNMLLIYVLWEELEKGLENVQNAEKINKYTEMYVILNDLKFKTNVF